LNLLHHMRIPYRSMSPQNTPPTVFPWTVGKDIATQPAGRDYRPGTVGPSGRRCRRDTESGALSRAAASTAAPQAMQACKTGGQESARVPHDWLPPPPSTLAPTEIVPSFIVSSFQTITPREQRRRLSRTPRASGVGPSEGPQKPSAVAASDEGSVFHETHSNNGAGNSATSTMAPSCTLELSPLVMSHSGLGRFRPGIDQQLGSPDWQLGPVATSCSPSVRDKVKQYQHGSGSVGARRRSTGQLKLRDVPSPAFRRASIGTNSFSPLAVHGSGSRPRTASTGLASPLAESFRKGEVKGGQRVLRTASEGEFQRLRHGLSSDAVPPPAKDEVAPW
jgi:hypothetical protein